MGKGRVASSVAALAAVLVAGVIATGCIPEGSVLKGRVASTTGAASGVPIVVYSGDSDVVVAQTVTDGQGDYGFDTSSLPDGTYRVRFSSTDWWQGASDWSSATPVVVSSASPVTIDETLAPAVGSVEGTVTDGSGPVGAVSVTAINQPTGTTVASTTTAGDGTYSFSALPAAGYVFRFQAPGLAIRYNASALTPATAPVVEIAPNEHVTGIDTVLSAEATITGQVVGDSTPLAGMVVAAFDKATGRGISWAETGPDGRFTVGGVSDLGSYTIEALDPAGARAARVVGTASADPADGTAFTPTGGTVDVGVIDMGAVTTADCSAPAGPGVEWSGCDLSGRDLSNADLTDADLTDADLGSTNLAGTTLTGADLTGVRSGGITGTPVLPAGWNLILGYLVGPGANLDGAVLTYNDPHFASRLALHGVDLSNASLVGADLGDGTEIWNANLTGADLTGANLYATDIRYSDLSGAILTDVNLEGPFAAEAGTSFLYNNLTGITSGGIVGRAWQIAMTDGSSWDVTGGYLVGPGVDLSGLDLRGLDFTGGNLNGVDLTGADMSGLDLTGVRFTGATLNNTQLTGTTLTGASSGGIVGTPVGLPAGWELSGGYLFGPGADLSGADLHGLDLTGVDLVGANLSGANLTGADLSGLDLTGVRFTGATLTNTKLTGTTLTGAGSGGIVGTPIGLPAGWRLTGGYLAGPGVDLSGLDLTGLDFTGVDFTGADLSGANLSGVNLTGTQLASADLASVRSGGITGTPASLPPGMTVVNGYLVGTGVDLRSVNFDGADLSGVDLSGSDLTGASFHGANLSGTNFADTTLTGVVSSGIVGTPVGLPTGWTVASGYLVGPGANLSSLVISGADFTGVDFTGVDLTGATLANVNLTNAKLAGATVTGIISSGIAGAPATLPTGFTVNTGFLVGPGANLSGKDLTAINTTGLTLAGVNLTGAKLSGLDLRGVDFTNAQLAGAIFHGANLDGAVLSTNDPHLASRFNLHGVDLSNASLVGANLGYGTEIWSANLTGANLTGASLYASDIRYSDLTGAILTNVSFAGPPGSFGGTILLYNTLTGITSGGIIGQPSMISMSDGSTWQVVDGYLVQTS